MKVNCIICDKELESDFLAKENLMTCRCDNCLQVDISYIQCKAIALLNEIIDTAKDLTPKTIINEKFEITGDLFAEIYNFLTNNNL